MSCLGCSFGHNAEDLEKAISCLHPSNMAQQVTSDVHILIESDDQLTARLKEPGLKGDALHIATTRCLGSSEVMLPNSEICDAVIELYADWCGPCKAVVPTFKKMRLEQTDACLLTFLLVRGPLLTCASHCTCHSCMMCKILLVESSFCCCV